MKLYELNHAYQQIIDMIEDGTEGLGDTLEALNDAIEEKVENIAKVVKTLDSEALAIKAEEQRLAERRRHLENNAKRLKEYAEQSMQLAQIKKVKGSVFTLSIQKNPPSVEITDEKSLPESYYVEQKPTLDKKSLLADLKAGVVIEGAQIKQSESLRIK